MSDEVRREGIAAVPWAWIAFWLALAIGHIGAAMVAPERPGVSMQIGCKDEGV